MNYDDMTDEERSVSDRLKFFYEEKFEVHITLKRVMQNGKPIWYNGYLEPTASKKVWTIKDRKLGNIQISLIDIRHLEEVKV